VAKPAVKIRNEADDCLLGDLAKVTRSELVSDADMDVQVLP
jgi:hypothetical protein